MGLTLAGSRAIPGQDGFTGLVRGESAHRVTQIKSGEADFAKSANPDTGVRSHSAEKTIAKGETQRKLN